MTVEPQHTPPSPGSPRQARRRGRALWWVASAAVVVLIAGGLGVGLTLAHQGLPDGAQRDMHGNTVTLDPGTVPSKSVRKKMNAVSTIGERIIVPSVGLNAPIGEMNVVDGTLTPPGFTSVYAVRNLGARVASPGSGTVFLITHSLRGGGVAPGNYLINVSQHKAAVADGATIEVAGIRYTVTGSRAIAKPDIGKQANLWADIPNRLVIITCLQVPAQTESVDNMVIIATRTK